MTVNDELMHYGVLGMKWGVRKDRSALARTKIGRKIQGRKDAKRLSDAKLDASIGSRKRLKALKSEIEEKSKDAAYKASFDKRTKELNDGFEWVRKMQRDILLATAAAQYALHKNEVDTFVKHNARVAYESVMIAAEKAKRKKG